MNKQKNLPELPPGITVVDTHCHLDMADYEVDRQAVIEEAVAAGVTRLITIGIDLQSSRRARLLADCHPAVYATVGIHPHHVAGLPDTTYDELKALAAHPKVVAIGEIGLDFVKCYAPPDQQRTHFQRQLKLARELGLPVIIHDRGAHEEIMAALTAAAPFPAGGVMHCFSGDLHLAEQVLTLGFHISVPGVVTFNKAAELQEVARQVPLASLLLETDCPYLAPDPWRGRRNKPAYVLHTAQRIAELRGISLQEVALRTTENAERLFRLDSGRPS